MDYAGLLPVSSGLFSPVISAAKKCGALDFSAFSYCASDRSAFRHVVMKKPRPQPPTALPRAVRFLLAPPPPAVRTEACHRSAPDRGPPGPSALGVPDETGMQPNTADPAFEYPDRQAGEGTFPHLLSVQDLMKIFGRSESAMRSWVGTRLGKITVGRSVFVHPDEVRRLIHEGMLRSVLADHTKRPGSELQRACPAAASNQVKSCAYELVVNTPQASSLATGV